MDKQAQQGPCPQGHGEPVKEGRHLIGYCMTLPQSSSTEALRRSCRPLPCLWSPLSSFPAPYRSSLTPGPASPSSEFCQVIEFSWPHSCGLQAVLFPHISGFSSWAPWGHSWLQMALASSLQTVTHAAPAPRNGICLSLCHSPHAVLPSCLVGSISTSVINLQGQGSCLFNLCIPYSVFVFLVLNKWWFKCVKSSPSSLCTLWWPR